MLESCRETVDNGDRIIREQEGRILELERDVTRLEEMNKDALDAAKEVSGGKWYERVLSAGKWIALGTLVGFAIGAAQ